MATTYAIDDNSKIQDNLIALKLLGLEIEMIFLKTIKFLMRQFGFKKSADPHFAIGTESILNYLEERMSIHLSSGSFTQSAF
ncbi:MAG: hypothetical protein RBR43_07195 [Desulfuromonadaceae bacterium]|nr:hypothetical protein [Desulfuromonas sp.]MDY0185644.1 hypothetical protein [Desulfuromonadaceae bacterium]